MKLLLVSHGDLANGILNSFEMIAGDRSSLDYIALTDDGVGEFRNQLHSYIQGSNEPVLILADVQSGTPYNESFKLYLENPQEVRVVSGLNLAMLLEVGLQFKSFNDLDMAAQLAKDAGSKGIVIAQDDSDVSDEIEF